MMKRFWYTLLSAMFSYSVFAQVDIDNFNPLFTTPLRYTALHTTGKITIDGDLAEPSWQQASWSALFSDIEGAAKLKPAYHTQIKMLWDDSTLYIAAALQEPQLSATLTQHDSIIFHDNDFEVFIDPDNDTHNYFEVEVNALNAIFDLFIPKPYRNNGDALIAYDVPHFQSAVQLHGTLNNPTDTDSGWTVEMAIPFRAVNMGFKTSYTPTTGSFYRINFSRVEWDFDVANGKYSKRKDSAGHNLPEHNWVWSPQGVINMHYPERWGYVFFMKTDTASAIPAEEKAKQYLWLLYYRQKDFFELHQVYATGLHELNIPASFSINQNNYRLSLEATSKQFTATLTSSANNTSCTINDEGLIKPAQ